MSFTGQVTVQVSGALRPPTAPDLGETSFNINKKYTNQLAPGTAANQADRAFVDTRTIAASGTDSIDLAGGITTPFGVASSSFAKVKTIIISAASGNTNNVVVGGSGSHTFIGPFSGANDKIAIPPGGSFAVTAPGAGWTVTAATGDLLLIANSSSGTAVTYDIVIIGTSA